MTRAAADDLVAEYDDLIAEYRIAIRLNWRGQEVANVAFAKMNACRERLLDALTGEEATQELPTQVSR